MPRFFSLLLILLALFARSASAAPDVVAREIPGSDFQSAHEALIEAIEGEGLVVGAVMPFGDMLVRTGGEEGSPYRSAEIIQFCSSLVARQLVFEDAEQIGLCPMTVAIYVSKVRPESVVIAYRQPATGSPARRQGLALLEKIVKEAIELARKN